MVLNLPDDFDEKILILDKLFNDLTEKVTQLMSRKILEEIDKITLEEQYEFISAKVDENVDKNQINLKFNIENTEKLYVDSTTFLEIM